MVSIKTRLVVFYQPQGLRDLVNREAHSLVVRGWLLGIIVSRPGDKSFWKSQYLNYTCMSFGQSVKHLELREIEFSPIVSALILSHLSRQFSFFLILKLNYQKLAMDA